MQLLYVWIEKYNSIEKQGFNFSSEYHFEIDDPDNPKKITCTKNERYINNFFGTEVNNITAIIGANGTGKSSILEYLTNILSNVILNKTNKQIIDLLFVFKNNGVVYFFKGRKFNTINFDGIKPIDGKILLKSHYSIFNNINDNSKTCPFLFYSNVFDSSKQLDNKKNVYDISTNFLLNKEKYNENFQVSQIDYFRSSEIKRQMTFLLKYKEHISLKHYFEYYPKSLSVYFSTEEVYRKESYIASLDEKLASELKNNSIRKDLITYKERQKLLFYRGFMAHFFNNFYRNTVSGDGQVKRLEDIQLDVIDNENDYILAARLIIEKVTSEYTSKTKRRDISSNYLKYSKLKEEVFTIFNCVDKFINNTNKLNEETDDYALFEIELEDLNGFNDFYNSYKNYLNIFNNDLIDDIVRFDWRNMSTGEKAKLNLFSRFNYAKEKFKDDHELIVLIDEGETFYHPQWQKEYIHDLIEFVPEILGNKKIQFILASNSPIIVSDLPKDNIIFLEKVKTNDGEKTVVSKLTEHRETFAANIHSLFRDAFFVKDGLFGKFATQKIEDIIELVDDHKKLKANEEYVRKFLPLIGEDVIRNKLQTMMKRTLETDLVRIDKRIETLEKELQDLKKQKNDSDKKK